jgi:hypothetical protein
VRRLPSFGVVFVAGSLLVAGTGSIAFGQSPSPTVDSPNPEECTDEPRSIDDLMLVVGSPPPAGSGEENSAARAASPEPFELLDGEPADEETVAGVTETIRQLFACMNAGEALRGMSRVTDEFIRTQVGYQVYDEDTVAFLQASPVPLPEEQQVQLHGIREITRHADGRVGALVDYFGPAAPPESPLGWETDLFIFEQQADGEWHLDESIENLEGQHPPEVPPRTPPPSSGAPSPAAS